MLSDVTGMVGGETEIKRGDGKKLKAIGPSIGSVSGIRAKTFPGYHLTLGL